MRKIHSFTSYIKEQEEKKGEETKSDEKGAKGLWEIWMLLELLVL